MKYYRLWIYSCNLVLGFTSAIFVIFAAFVIADVRLYLGGIELYHPTFLYAYTALVFQCGIIQTIGCLGVKRLSHKLLNLYWTLILILTIGDVIVGLVWKMKLDKMKVSLKESFMLRYSSEVYYTNSWDYLQSTEFCCGVDGPIDFDRLATLRNTTSTPSVSQIPYLIVPQSCCTLLSQSQLLPTFSSNSYFESQAQVKAFSRRESISGANPNPNLYFNNNSSQDEGADDSESSGSPEEYFSNYNSQLPGFNIIDGGSTGHKRRHFANRRKTPTTNQQQKNYSSRDPYEYDGSQREVFIHLKIPSNHLPIYTGGSNGGVDNLISFTCHKNSFNLSGLEQSEYEHEETNIKRSSLNNAPKEYEIFSVGCGIKIIQWLDTMSGIAFILGFCIIGFVKACFLVILKYEIKEMISKIALMDTVDPQPLSPMRGGGILGPHSNCNYIQTQTSMDRNSNCSGIKCEVEHKINHNNFRRAITTERSSFSNEPDNCISSPLIPNLQKLPNNNNNNNNNSSSKEKNVLIRVPPKEKAFKKLISDDESENCELLDFHSFEENSLNSSAGSNNKIGISIVEPLPQQGNPYIQQRINGNNNNSSLISGASFGTAV